MKFMNALTIRTYYMAINSFIIKKVNVITLYKKLLCTCLFVTMKVAGMYTCI